MQSSVKIERKKEIKVEIGPISKIRKPITKLKRVQTYFDTIRGENEKKIQENKTKISWKLKMVKPRTRI
jgi:hypothetical protein